MNMNIYSLRTSFTLAWDELNSKVKSIVISVGAFVLASSLLMLAKTVYPQASFSQVELVIITAFSGFLISLAKDNIKI